MLKTADFELVQQIYHAIQKLVM